MSDNNHLVNSKGRRYGRSPIFVIFMTLFIDATGFGIVFPLLPSYAIAFQVGSATLSILFASFAFMQFISAPILGRISDRVGRKPVLIISILTSLASFLLFAFADSFFMLLLSRVIAGFATEAGVAQGYIADITSPKKRAAGIGKVGAAHGAGFIMGPAIGGLLSPYGFSAPGFAAAFLTLINLAFVILFLPESLRKEDRLQSAQGPNTGFIQRILVALAKPLTGTALTIFFIVFLSFSALPVIGPLITMAFFGFTETEIAYIFVYIGIIQIVMQGFVIGRLTERFGEEKLITFGPLLMALGLSLMPVFRNFIIHMFALAMVSSSSGMMRTIVPSFISKRTHVNEQGGTLGVTSSVASIATVPGPLIGGFLFEFAGLPAPFLTSAALLIIAFLIGYRVFQSYTRKL